jgi:hypothetical protein
MDRFTVRIRTNNQDVSALEELKLEELWILSQLVPALLGWANDNKNEFSFWKAKKWRSQGAVAKTGEWLLCPLESIPGEKAIGAGDASLHLIERRQPAHELK